MVGVVGVLGEFRVRTLEWVVSQARRSVHDGLRYLSGAPEHAASLLGWAARGKARSAPVES